MPNEIIFLVHTLIIVGAMLASLGLGQSALVAFISLQCVLANLFVLKQITIFGFSATCADAFTIGATLGLNLLQEYFGREIAKKTIYINFFALIFFAIIPQIHLWYMPSTFDISQGAFSLLLTPMPRIIVASFIAFFISQNVDYLLYGFLRRIWTHKWLVARNYASVSVSQLVDTILFSLLGLYGLVSNIGHIILVSYLIKLIAIAVGTPLVAFSRHFVFPGKK
jgi:uncharacterized integral membrane protein (TIGR00697 family)